jgi:uncharacterized protein
MDIPRYHRLRRSLYNLEGCRCAKCGARFFPARPHCTSCGSRSLAPHAFGGTGSILTFSEVFSPPEGHGGSGPYIIALVRLDEGVNVLAQLTDVESADVHSGLAVEAVVRKIKENGPNGTIVYGYKFRPVMTAA